MYTGIAAACALSARWARREAEVGPALEGRRGRSSAGRADFYFRYAILISSASSFRLTRHSSTLECTIFADFAAGWAATRR
jgi:hypothetical protein